MIRKHAIITADNGDPVAYGQKTAGRVKRWQLTVAKRLYCSEFPEVPIKYAFLSSPLSRELVGPIANSAVGCPPWHRHSFSAIPQKSPCACSLECGPLLTQVIELCLGLSQGAALPAEPLAMRSKTLPLLRQVLRRGLTEG